MSWTQKERPVFTEASEPTSDLPVPVEPTTAMSGARWHIVDILYRSREELLSIKKMAGICTLVSE